MYVYKYIFYLYEKHQSPCAYDYLSVPSDIALICKNQLIMCNMTYMCAHAYTRVYQTTSFVNQIEPLRYIAASISYNTGKYIFFRVKKIITLLKN